MKKLFFILMFLLPLVSNGQSLLRYTVGSYYGQRLTFVGADSSNDGNSGVYWWNDISTDSNDYNIVLRPYVIGVDPEFPLVGRWIKDQRPYEVEITTATYTVSNSDFEKILEFTYDGARTITLPPIDIVNSKRPVWIKDGAFHAGTSGKNITINYSGGIDGGTSKVIDTDGGVLGFSKDDDGVKYLAQ